MVGKSLVIVKWDKTAYSTLQRIYNYIKKDSLSNAESVLKGILQVTASLPKHPEKYPLDKFKVNNTGSYRAFEKYSYRIAYKIDKDEIRILRIRHIKQEPKVY